MARINKSTLTRLEIVQEASKQFLEKGYIPVISTIGCDREGNSYNINGDTAAAYIAGALGAERLIMMTDIAGILRDREDPNSLIHYVSISEAEQLKKEDLFHTTTCFLPLEIVQFKK